ncbi:oxoprolinase family protein [Sulfurovum sp. NBC37-1]|uniref:oxoprolinase family protein n=1 Tax=Sulfurovum sp. (strain NBC37-1) TaxID=387093 RepID=UPI000158756C|nr:oxoprolinase family protein [Sulfurovum sp. NBC37-1]BAF71819.1 5-oxoprolinase (ATP-hydrolyzing) [Sulfurovum sp. NBC37-1]
MKFSIDRGGTFTDVYAEHDGQIYIEKLLSVDPANYDDAPREGIRRLLGRISSDAVSLESVPEESIEWIRMGTTVTTNALLEKKGARTALLITKGFRDLLEIGYQNRPELFDLNIKKPEVLYEEVVEIDERVLPIKEGGGFEVIKPLDIESAKETMQRLKSQGIEALAIVLLHSYQFFEHEEILGEIAEELGFEQVSLSHRVIPSVKAVIRGDTTVVDAYLTPHIRRYINDFSQGFRNRLAETELLFMQSHGGLSPTGEFRGSNAILSGPAGGVLGLSSLYEDKALIGFDMGGTSTDVSRYDGKLDLRFESEIAGTVIRSPQLDIMTVAAGGGSRLFYKNGMFVVGPESSGADPGPVCYRKGGYLSITDANAVLGRIVPSQFPKIFGKSENEALDVEASREAFEALAEEINRDVKKPLSVEEIAYGFLKVANDTMSKPIVEVSVARGYDIRSHSLASFGGAGGQHACAIAEYLGLEEVIVHRFAGILSAYGIGQADIIHNDQVSIEDRLSGKLLEKIEKQFEKLKSKREGAIFKRALLIRYEGTDYSMLVEETKDFSFAESFANLYHKQFGFSLDLPLIVDEIQLQSRIVTQKSERPVVKKSNSAKNAIETVKFYGEKGWQDAKLYRLEALEWGDKIAGSAIIIDDTSTIVVEDGSDAKINRYGDVVISLSQGKKGTQKPAEAVQGPNAIELSIFANLFISIAKQMGAVLQNAAVSTNIKERLDFSCALFDNKGNLIANAPHVPVHLGSMSFVVKAMLKKFSGNIQEGDVFISNAPFEGGSHLPDITLITPLLKNGEIYAIAASRGHHADIGGAVPGSMPSFSTTLKEEGAIFTLQKIVEKHYFAQERIVEILRSAGARRIEENITDIQAQIAANKKGIDLLEDAMQQHGSKKLSSYMEYIQDVSFRAISKKLEIIAQRKGGVLEAEDYLDNGSKIALKITIKGDRATFDFTGTSAELNGNQNTPPSVLSSAIVYVLRSIIDDDLPLNEGLMRAVDIVLPSDSLLNPSPDAAVVGGNVTTSQRIVDVILKAFGSVAASQGCMNNITFGNENFGYYETIAGGAGAGVDSDGAGFDGADAVHTHMTNTLITDPEVIERRYPVMIEEFSVREDSGGKGEWHGGNGVVRTYRFFEPVTVNLLTERRVYAPWGANGASDGAKGINEHFHDGKWHRVEGKASIRVKAGEKIRIRTPGGGGYGLD